MKRVWKEVPRDETRAQWAGIYVTMNSKGVIVMNRAAHEQLGRPEAFVLLFDAANGTIGLKPATLETKNAYPAAKSGTHGGRKLNAYRVLKEYGINVRYTLYFPDAELDLDGVLLLNLSTAVIPNRVLKHPTRRAGVNGD